MTSDRLDRQLPLFGKEGQARLDAARVAVVGIGGLGTHVVQQLALLHVRELGLVDSEELATTDRNRYVGARHDDPIPGTPKVGIGERIVREIDPTIRVHKVRDSLVSEAGFNEVIAADYVFGCLDSEGARLVLTELCAAYAKPFLDLASDIVPSEAVTYGGRVCVAWDGHGCLVCRGQIDIAEAQAELSGPEGRRLREAIYGVNRGLLGRSGPSVVSINGVVASLGVTEFMAAVTGLRPPRGLLKYYGNTGKVAVSTDTPLPDCYYCERVRGQGAAADVQRYRRAGVGAYLR